MIVCLFLLSLAFCCLLSFAFFGFLLCAFGFWLLALRFLLFAFCFALLALLFLLGAFGFALFALPYLLCSFGFALFAFCFLLYVFGFALFALGFLLHIIIYVGLYTKARLCGKPSQYCRPCALSIYVCLFVHLFAYRWR